MLVALPFFLCGPVVVFAFFAESEDLVLHQPRLLLVDVLVHRSDRESLDGVVFGGVVVLLM